MAFHFVNSARLACIPHSMLLAALAGIALHTLVQPAAGLTLPPLPVVEQWVDREYVYGPDYVDEFLAQFDRDGRPMLMLQDGNFNVVALIAGADDVFFDAGTNGLPAGSVLEQYVYDPYGGVRQADSFAEHAVKRVGHQGLFFDRFDGDWENASLAPGAVGLYYNRNRFYSPPGLRNVGDAENPDWRLVGLGRFISADPNETALTLVSALAMNGQSLGGPDSGGFSIEGHYGDGFNLYQYLGSNPFNGRDPLGLDVWDDFDDAIADIEGHRVASLGYIHEGSGWAIAGMRTALDVAGSILGFDVIRSAGAIMSNEAGFWDYLNVGLAAMPLVGSAARSASVIALRGYRWVRKMATHGRAARGNTSLTHLIRQTLCFAAGTLVAMSDGTSRPIETLGCGDSVLTACNYDDQATAQPALIVRVFRSEAREVVELVIREDRGEYTLTVTPDHRICVPETQEFCEASSLTPGTRLKTLLAGREAIVVAVQPVKELTAVYNIEVADCHTFYVSAHVAAAPVLVHNEQCGFKTFGALKRHLGSPGEGKVWHHVVEQSQIRKRGEFAAERIHSVDNVVALERSLNEKLNGFYSSKQSWSDGMRVRDWLRKHKSFEEQHEFGLRMIKELGGGG